MVSPCGCACAPLKVLFAAIVIYNVANIILMQCMHAFLQGIPSFAFNQGRPACSRPKDLDTVQFLPFVALLSANL